jgi:hypothetical protein
VDPIDSRKAERADAAARAGLNTFGEVADTYIAAYEATWRSAKRRLQWRNTLDTYVAPVIGKLSVAKVEHRAALPCQEIGGFLARLAGEEGISALALRFAILTAARTAKR